MEDMAGHRTFRLRCIGLQAVGHEEHFDFSPEGQKASVQRHMDWQAEGLALLKDIKEMCAGPWCESATKKLAYPPGTTLLPEEEDFDYVRRAALCAASVSSWVIEYTTKTETQPAICSRRLRSKSLLCTPLPRNPIAAKPAH